LFSYLEYEGLDQFLTNRYYNGQRNETTHYNSKPISITRGIPSDDTYVDIEMVIDIPREQRITYAPGVWEVLKFAWIQYYSFFALLYVFLYHFFYGFVIKNKVFYSMEISEVNVNSLL
jgi:hypothetical protein